MGVKYCYKGCVYGCFGRTWLDGWESEQSSNCDCAVDLHQDFMKCDAVVVIMRWAVKFSVREETDGMMFYVRISHDGGKPRVMCKCQQNEQNYMCKVSPFLLSSYRCSSISFMLGIFSSVGVCKILRKKVGSVIFRK